MDFLSINILTMNIVLNSLFLLDVCISTPDMNDTSYKIYTLNVSFAVTRYRQCPVNNAGAWYTFYVGWGGGFWGGLAVCVKVSGCAVLTVYVTPSRADPGGAHQMPGHPPFFKPDYFHRVRIRCQHHQ